MSRAAHSKDDSSYLCRGTVSRDCRPFLRDCRPFYEIVDPFYEFVDPFLVKTTLPVPHMNRENLYIFAKIQNMYTENVCLRIVEDYVN